MYPIVPVVKLHDAIVPITRFDRGEASRIFQEVSESGIKVVLNDSSPVCVLIDPEYYDAIVEALEDYSLFLEAQKRMTSTEDGNFISSQDLMTQLGITNADLNEIEVEIEG